MNKDLAPQGGQFFLYETEDGKTRVECRIEEDTIWLPQAHIAELFETTPQNITQHLKNLYEDQEIEQEATCKEYLQVQMEGNREVSRSLNHYNLEAIISIGYRVRSKRGTQFRQWATSLLKQYLTEGIAMDDERLKNPDASLLFEKILARIRDIRSSEKVFWRKICDIYATSTDYDGKTDTARNFFKMVQNKMHWAAHGQTAAEIIHHRVDASQPHLGLTHYQGAEPTKKEVETAKNYLQEDEVNILNRIVTAYLEFAELQALNRRPMKMENWSSKLDDFLKLGDHDLLTHAGKISAKQAKEKAHLEYDKFRKVIDLTPSQVEKDFQSVIKNLEARIKSSEGSENEEE